MRKLTKHFYSYVFGEFMRRQNIHMMDLINDCFANMNVSLLVGLISAGNTVPSKPLVLMDEVKAGEILDNYLAEEGNSLFDAFFDVLDELDKDIKLMKSFGVDAKDLKANLKARANEAKKINNLNAETESKTEITEDSVNTEN